jgi:hypothetical protein
LLVAGLVAVREAFDRAGYRPDPLRALLGAAHDIPTGPADLLIYQRRLAANPGALADLVALLTLGSTVPIDRIATAIGVTALDLLLASGCIVEADSMAQPAVRLIPHNDLWITADRRSHHGGHLQPMHVSGINPPASLLAAMTVRRPASTGLDIGAGGGIQSLLMARHCERVVATDVNPRALAFAAFNAALNDVTSIEFRDGSLFEPVAGERFDLIVCNPPYVISPDHELTYRDSGAEPGALCGAVISGVPDYLADSGFATVLASWPLRADGQWWDVPMNWLSAGCRAWLMQLSVEDTLQHAQQWNVPLAIEGDLAGFGDAVDRWLRYTDERGIDRVGYGAVIMQQRTGACSVIRTDDVRAGRGSATAHVERVFAAHDLLADLDDNEVLDLICHAAAEHRVQRGIHYSAGEWRAGAALVSLDEGMGIEVTLDPLMTEVFFEVTSGATVLAAATEVGRLAGVAPDQLDELVAAAASMVRSLLALGIVEAGPPPNG